MVQHCPRGPELYNMQYDDILEDVLRPPHGKTPAAEKIKFSYERRSSGSKENTKETKKADSVLLSLFMCSNVMVQHCQRPLHPLVAAPAELYFQTDSECAEGSQRTRRYIICTMMMYGGDVLWPLHGTTLAAVKIK